MDERRPKFDDKGAKIKMEQLSIELRKTQDKTLKLENEKDESDVALAIPHHELRSSRETIRDMKRANKGLEDDWNNMEVMKRCSDSLCRRTQNSLEMKIQEVDQIKMRLHLTKEDLEERDQTCKELKEKLDVTTEVQWLTKSHVQALIKYGAIFFDELEKFKIKKKEWKKRELELLKKIPAVKELSKLEYGRLRGKFEELTESHELCKLREDILNEQAAILDLQVENFAAEAKDLAKWNDKLLRMVDELADENLHLSQEKAAFEKSLAIYIESLESSHRFAKRIGDLEDENALLVWQKFELYGEKARLMEQIQVLQGREDK